MKKNLILHPIFIVSLLILLLNDFYFKQMFSNLFTGKLSDFTGLIVFPIFIGYLFPNSKKWISIATGILFIIWKTPLVSPMIELFNVNLPFRIQRIVDYSDYWALLVLPLTYKIINQNIKITFISDKNILRVSKIALTGLSFFAICATSMPPRIETPKGTIYIGKKYTINKSKEEIVKSIKSLGYNVNYYKNLEDSTSIEQYHSIRIPYYQTDNIVIYDDDSNPIDTILNLKYTLYEFKGNKTKIKIINVTLNESRNIQKWQALKYLSRQYKKVLEKQMIKKIE